MSWLPVRPSEGLRRGWLLALALSTLTGCDIGRQYDDAVFGVQMVAYHVSGEGRACVRYVDAQATFQEDYVVLPWSHRFQTETEQAYYLGARVLPGSSDLDLRLAVDGEVVGQERAEGEFTFAAVAGGALDPTMPVRYRVRGFHDRGTITFLFPTDEKTISIEAVRTQLGEQGVDTVFVARRGERLGIEVLSRKLTAQGKLCLFLDIDLHTRADGDWVQWVSRQRCAAREDILTFITRVP